MIRGLATGVLVLLAVALAGFVAQRLFGSHADHPISEAQEALDAVSFGVDVHEGPQGVLIGTVSGRNAVVHFAVAKTRDAPGVPASLRRWDDEPGAGGPFWIWDDAERGSSQQTKIEREDRAELAVELEDALCRKVTGDTCPG